MTPILYWHCPFFLGPLQGYFDEEISNKEKEENDSSISISSDSNLRFKNLLETKRKLKAGRGRKRENIDGTPISSSITLPSIFATTNVLGKLRQVQARTGEFFRIYELPGYRNNCGLAGIYGREVDRAEVAQQLLDAFSNVHVLALMATDIAVYISNEITTLPTWLQGRRRVFENLEQLRQLSLENEAFRSEFLQDEEVFREYVIRAESSPMLRYNENNEEAMAAIVALNHVSLDIYQEFEQIDGSKLLERRFSYKDSQANGKIICLLHMSQNPRNSNNLNHFQLLLECDCVTNYTNLPAYAVSSPRPTQGKGNEKEEELDEPFSEASQKTEANPKKCKKQNPSLLLDEESNYSETDIFLIADLDDVSAQAPSVEAFQACHLSYINFIKNQREKPPLSRERYEWDRDADDSSDADSNYLKDSGFERNPLEGEESVKNNSMNLYLSFLAHEYGIRILNSEQVTDHYHKLNSKYLAGTQMLS